jgi:cyclopropane fatty-acyl-phospholipid synthase-like methyltransferase
MTLKVDLYNSSYGNYALDPYREVRLETYGEDLGQTSWVTTEESHEIPLRLELRAGHFVLEIGCGSGHYAVYIAEGYGCRIVGLDLNSEGIANANQLAEQKKLASQATFQHYDVCQPLPFPNETFDAAFSNDVFCHVPGRLSLLCELHRVLKPGGRMLFSDALIVGGMLSHEEIATRSSIGRYFFVPAGENEKLIEKAGFKLLAVTDTTENAAAIARRWHDAREKREAALAALEGEANFAGLQRFLMCAQTLAGERRLLRCVYLARK